MKTDIKSKFEVPNFVNIFQELKNMYMHLVSIKSNYVPDENEALNEKLKEVYSLITNIDYDLYHELKITFNSISRLFRALEEAKDIINSLLGGIIFYK